MGDQSQEEKEFGDRVYERCWVGEGTVLKGVRNYFVGFFVLFFHFWVILISQNEFRSLHTVALLGRLGGERAFILSLTFNCPGEHTNEVTWS